MISPLASKQLIVILFLLAIALIIGACNLREAQTTTTPTPPSTPSPPPTPGCTPVPQITGEKVILPTVEATPHLQAAPGETLSFTFSGHYVIQNNQLVCGEDRVVVEYYLSDDELPGWSWKREIVVWLVDQKFQGQELKRVDCYFTCDIVVEIPAGAIPGHYTLEAENYNDLYGFTLDFVLEITNPNQ
jgi:hypothetical protein